MKKYLIEAIVILIILANYSFATHKRNFIWKNDLSLEKKFLTAIPYFKTALKHNPYFSYAHFNLGTAYQGICQYDNAIAEYKKTLHGTRRPYFAYLHNNLGVCYFNKGWIDMAIKEFKKALNINPDFSDAGYNLRIALTRIKK